MNKATRLLLCISIFTLFCNGNNLIAQNTRLNHSQKHPDYQVAAYYFPNYHIDKRNEKYFGSGWTEWKLLKKARSRFKGQQQPKVPLWGYQDESDPKVMEKKISAASSYGIDAFIFDWYYYNDGPFLQSALEDGFMKAGNKASLKFALMWANHDYTDVFPVTLEYLNAIREVFGEHK